MQIDLRHDAAHTELNRQALEALLGTLGVTLAGEVEAAAAASSGELRLRLHQSREFGMVISATAAGLDGALEQSLFRKGRASAQALAALSSGADFLQCFQQTMAYQKLRLRAQQRQEAAPDAQLVLLFERMLALAADPARHTIRTLQSLDLTLMLRQGSFLATHASCMVGEAPAQRLARPIAKIDKLLHPDTIGLIGVSGSGMNFGRIILRNLIGSGYPKERLTIIRPGETEIDGVKCADSLKTLDHKLDLLIVAVAASAVYELVDEIIETDAVESVMLIPGGLGETAPCGLY